MIELSGSQVNPDFNPQAATPAASSSWLGMRAADYLAGVAHYGSPADTLAEVRASPEPIRQRADQMLAAAIGLGLRQMSAPAKRGCRTVGAGSYRGVRVPGGAVALRADAKS